MKKIIKFFAILILFLIINAEVETKAQAASLVASTEGTGTHFELSGSQFLNVSVDSTESVRLYLESLPKTITMIIEPQSVPDSSVFTLGGFLPSTVYHKYEDNYNNHEVITTDQYGRYTYNQDLSFTHLVFFQTVPSTIFIKDDANGGDCPAIGTWDYSSKTCTMTHDWNESIQVDDDWVTLDGNGYILTSGEPYSYGVMVSGKKNVTVKNMTIKNFRYGIGISMYAHNGKYINNVIQEFYHGFLISDSSMNQYIGNTVSGSGNYGFFFWNGNYGTIKDNIITGSQNGILMRSASRTNTVYNNLFKNVKNIRFLDTPFVNAWNIEKVSETNIAGGISKGGNFWGNMLDTGFSDLCADSDKDGICDSIYTINDQNADNLPLSKPDLIAPVTTALVSGTKGVSSWYLSDVSVSLGATDNAGGAGVLKTEYSFDNLNWIDYSMPFMVAAEGDTNVYFRSTDKAGNVEIAKNQIINIDKTSPILTGMAASQPNANDWYNNDVTIHFSCSDSVSGVFSVTPDKVINTEGQNQSTDGVCLDAAGNSSAFTVSGINIDKTAPELQISRTQAANLNGWNNTAVEAVFIASDSLSGIDGNTEETVEFVQEGANQSATKTFKDKAGNLSEGSIAGINIDKTAPTASGSLNSQPNVAGWYNTDVVVNFTASDNLSGLISQPYSIAILTEGENQEASETFTDMAGNAYTAKVSGINIDKTSPTLTAAATIQPNANNWYNNNVIVHFLCTDNLSGVSSISTDKTVDTEGKNQSVDGVCLDEAENPSSFTLSGINIDKTAPVAFGSAAIPPNSNGWYNTYVAVNFTASDNLSGLISQPYNITISTEGANQEASETFTDMAGNTYTAKVSGINIDKTPPILTGMAASQPNANDWYNNDVTIHFSCSDSVSGVFSVTPDKVINTEGQNQSTDGVCLDAAGNSSAFTVSGINIDKTAPEIIINAPTENAEYLLGQNILADWLASDSLSGIETSSGTFPSGSAIDTSVAGIKTLAVSADDAAGNETSKNVSYSVILPPYDYSGVLSPINEDGSSVFKLGRTVPVKFQLRDSAGNFVTDSVATIYVSKFSDNVLGTEEEPESTSSASTGNLFRYDATDNQYIFNLDTKTLSAGTWQIRIVLDGNISKYVNISLR